MGCYIWYSEDGPGQAVLENANFSGTKFILNSTLQTISKISGSTVHETVISSSKLLLSQSTVNKGDNRQGAGTVGQVEH